MMNEFIHKVNGVKSSLHVVIPHSIIENLRISKGDFVEINQSKDQIIIKKLMVDK